MKGHQHIMKQNARGVSRFELEHAVGLNDVPRRCDGGEEALGVPFGRQGFEGSKRRCEMARSQLFTR